MRAAGNAMIGGLTATIALLGGSLAAHAQSAPGAGSFPSSFLLPGTNTSFKIGGYVKGDFTYDFSAQQNIIIGVNPNAIPLDANVPGTTASAGHSIHGTSQMTAAESRFNIETRTPTGYGELKTLIEGDFTNPSGLTNSNSFKGESNSSGFRLRYAYGTLGPWLVGQNVSLFRDVAAEAETLDFFGPIGAGVYRQPQFRYTYEAGNGLLIAAAAENPQAFWTDANTVTFGGTGSTSFGTGQGDKIPDFTATATLNAPWGHVALRSVFRDFYDHNGTAVSVSHFGWGLGVSGNLNTWGKDNLIVQASGGDGIGRYASSFIALVPDAVVNNATNTMKTIGAWGGQLAYQHWWTDTLRSTAAGSYLKQENPSGIFTPAAFAVQSNHWWTLHVNLIWSPVPRIDTGIEYIHENRTIENGQRGNLNRMQVSTKFKF